MFITIKLFCSKKERMQKHAWVACFKLKVRKSIFYTVTFLIFVKTENAQFVLSPATSLYFQLYFLGKYNSFFLNAYSFFSRSGVFL